MKIRLYPTKAQLKKLELLMDAARYAWNILIEKIGNRLYDPNPKVLKEDVRKYVKKSNIPTNLYVSAAPDECFDSAFRDIFKARKSTMALSKALKKKTGKGFKLTGLKYKKKNQGGDSIELRSRNFTYLRKLRKIRFFPTFFGFSNKDGIKIKTDLRGVNINYSCRLLKTDDRFYLCIPTYKPVTIHTNETICALDPGIRTFMTGYDPMSGGFEYANKNQYIYTKQMAIRKLQSSMVGASKKGRIKIKRRIKDIYRKIKNCIADLHHKVAKDLAQNYREIIIPVFNTKDMTMKKNNGKRRVINRTAAHRLLTFSHYKFRQLLISKCSNYGSRVIECDERYTSKTCGNCGRLNHKLGASKIFRCPYEGCRLLADRDVNAARNIFIKNLHLGSFGLEATEIPEPAGLC
jgi:IS605 OrfB family transposase